MKFNIRDVMQDGGNSRPKYQGDMDPNRGRTKVYGDYWGSGAHNKLYRD